MKRPRVLLLAISLGACATTPALPDLPLDHPARADAPETAPPPRTPTLRAESADLGEQHQTPAPAPSRRDDDDTGSHR